MDKKSGSYQGLETNLDHYKNEILGNGMWNLAVVKGKPKRCDCTVCGDCDFYKDGTEYCLKESMNWLKQQYIKPTYKLTKFEEDLLQSCLRDRLSRCQFKSMEAERIQKNEKALFDACNIPEVERDGILDAAQEAFRNTFLEELAMRSNNVEILDIENKEEK